MTTQQLINAQSFDVKGVVKSEDVTLPGALIAVKGNGNVGTVTDINGEFSIQAKKDDTLVVSFLGFKTIEVPVNGRKQIEVVLTEEMNELDEVVVIGYGAQKKEDLTGSVGRVGKEILEKTNTASFENELQGRMAGVQVTSNSGQPGASSTIRIRGVNSLGGNSNPLYVIDGVPLISNTTGGFAQEEGAQLSALADLNPKDIESIEVLKDASSTAIYGAMGSNGVILITTKKGEEGKIRVNSSLNYSVHEVAPWMYIDMIDANDFINLRKEAGHNVSEENLELAQNGQMPSTDWQKEFYKQGRTVDGNVTVSGGTKKYNFYTSAGYYDSEGIIPNSGYTRFSLKGSFNANLSDKVRVGSSMNFSRSMSDVVNTATSFNDQEGQSSVVYHTLRSHPTMTVNGENLLSEDFLIQSLYNTPITLANSNTTDYINNNLIGNLYFKYKPIDGLEFESKFGFYLSQRENSFYRDRSLYVQGYNGGWARRRFTNVNTWNWDNMMRYNKKWGKLKSENLLLVNARYSGNHYIQQEAKNFPSDATLYHDMGAGLIQMPNVSGIDERTMLSGVARSILSFDDRYFLTMSIRADGASQFSEGNKWGYFPAISGAWKINNEKFLKDKKNIDLVKLRIGYGENGNPATYTGQSLSTFNSGRIILGNPENQYSSYQEASFTNDELRWEKTKEINFGLDLAFFKERIAITADYYKKNTEDLLLNTNVPAFTGFQTGLLNVGTLENEGFEFSLTTVNIERRNFSWSTTSNITLGKTIITELLTDPLSSGYQNPWVSGPTQRLIVGEELGTFWGYKSDGIYQYSDFEEFQGMTQEQAANKFKSDIARDPQVTYTPWKESDIHQANQPGQQKYKDVNGDGKISVDDQTIIGTAQPDFVWSMNNTFSYKNLELSIYFVGEQGKDMANLTNWRLSFMDGNSNITQEMYDTRWTPDNPSSTNHRPSRYNTQSQLPFSDLVIEDASYIRLKRVSMTYRFKMNKTRGSIMLSANDIYTWTNYKGYNPDVSLNGANSLMMGHDYGIYPLPITYTVGISLSL
ncbi:SusC/RagA family TonB-linked outer membrane protein [Flammeovirga agarivorans]|uniref:TonB-dependent receptor n=1 Tax=Flammeovirga agarivorans TaxID=2726742 RepID=A0A7X8SNT6_9BACT|nr:TonB-dependent receptor [Flammeovirga agarivorans]NLR93626.1 TonB-dependent receptor [Flammeovirga agarivorans]